MFALSALYGLRMLGLFMLLPVLAIYGEELMASPMQLGLAIGGYGLAQALLQIPFGMLSDRVGRKPVILSGLLLFAAGSVVAALASSIVGVIVGRILQGAGAIAGTVMALLSDLTRDETRSKAMAFVGMTIGVSFSVAMILGPLFSDWIGVSGIFAVTAALALGAMALVAWVVPTPRRLPLQQGSIHRDAGAVPELLGRALRDAELLRLNLGIFCLHFMLTACFLVVPLILRDTIGLELAKHWQVYLPMLLLSFVLMVPFIIFAEKKRQIKAVLLGAIVLLALVMLLLAANSSDTLAVIVALFLFFLGFNLLEATLPSLVSKICFAGGKGTATGIYSSCQFAGAFAGGVVGGWVMGSWGVDAVFLLGAAACALWLLFAASMRRPRHLTSLVLNCANDDQQQHSMLEHLLAIDGVEDAMLVEEECVVFLKIDEQIFDRNQLDGIAGLR